MAQQIEDAIDEEIANSVQQLLRLFGEERRRLMAPFRDDEKTTFKLTKNTTFKDLVLQLLQTPFGDVRQNGSSVIENNRQEKPEKKQSRFQNQSKNNQIDYLPMKFICELAGNDMFGDCINGPLVTALHERQCFALLHNDRVSLLNPFGRIIVTYKILKAPASSELKACNIRFLNVNPLNSDQLITTEHGIVKTIDLPPSSLKRTTGIVEAETRVERLPGFGLACCPETKCFFTKCDHEIVGFSLEDFSHVSSICMPSEFERFANVLSVRNGFLYCSGSGGFQLLRVPINTDGSIRGDRWQIVAGKFRQLRAITFDKEDNILVAHRGLGQVEVRSPSGQEILAEFRPPVGISGKFTPTDISLLIADPNKPFTKDDDASQRYSRVLAVSDFPADRVYFFGLPA